MSCLLFFRCAVFTGAVVAVAVGGGLTDGDTGTWASEVGVTGIAAFAAALGVSADVSEGRGATCVEGGAAAMEGTAGIWGIGVARGGVATIGWVGEEVLRRELVSASALAACGRRKSQ
jgi:hypothetical protein